jgi:hypothetical protein
MTSFCFLLFLLHSRAVTARPENHAEIRPDWT